MNILIVLCVEVRQHSAVQKGHYLKQNTHTVQQTPLALGSHYTTLHTTP